MADKNMTGAVETIEAEAERVLASAREKAREVLLKSREEASKILSSKGDMSQIQKECEAIKQRASAEAERKAREYDQEASRIRANAATRIDRIVKEIASIVAGEKA
jgi:cell division septum initiation protein DivIVA